MLTREEAARARVNRMLAIDPSLANYRGFLTYRLENYLKRRESYLTQFGTLKDMANLHNSLGAHPNESGWWIREFAPNAEDIFLLCDANQWKPKKKWAFEKLGNGNYQIHVPHRLLKHGSHCKLLITWPGGAGARIPSFAHRVVQVEGTETFNMQLWDMHSYHWKNTQPQKPSFPMIYEAHVGMAIEQPTFGTYTYFREKVLPHIAKAGYNTIQLMALDEHPYYGSFGYHVANFFAASSRFGTPNELKQLIDAAHGLGMCVIMDLVHSHAAKNKVEGLSHFDGSDHLYFHGGPRGHHPAWDTRCFDYGKLETLRFLLSNCRFWLEEYQLDGFRFDGVTSMLYHHHGLGRDFCSYENYFGGDVDEEAWIYMALANELIHELNPQATTIAEDMSGLPGLALPNEDGGCGFDYRLAMGQPDYWIKLLKERRDEDWHMGDLFYRLTDRRPKEKTIGYCESHDQALVGDQTLIFRMIGHHMYKNMSVFKPNLMVDRGVALHKMIRLLTLGCGGQGYLNFMGNEFGHPEWIDFPREGNQWSHAYARRQWSLANDTNLQYHKLNLFDRAMIAVLAPVPEFADSRADLIFEDSHQNLLVFLRADLLFVFNFHPTNPKEAWSFEVPPGTYQLLLNSADPQFGGYFKVTGEKLEAERCMANQLIFYQLKLDLPQRTALVLKRIKHRKRLET